MVRRSVTLKLENAETRIYDAAALIVCVGGWKRPLVTEVGVRLIGEDGKTPKERMFWTNYRGYRYGSPEITRVKRRGVVGRIEVLQPGGWQKLCINGKVSHFYIIR